MKKKAGIALALVLFGAIAVGISLIIYICGNYPLGADTMCHIYKGEVLLEAIKDGNWYPLYDNFWYNGVQMMRYWAPLPVYFLAMCQAIAGGNALMGYLVFVALIFFLGAVVWLYIGIKKNRTVLGIFLGVLWFFMPNNLYALFVEGNLPRSLSMVLLPAFIYLIYEFLFEDKWNKVKYIIPVFGGIVLCHTGYAGMIALAVLIFLVVYKIVYKEKGKVLTVIGSMVLPFLIIGVWLYPSLKGGITSTDSSQVMETFFQDALVSLNPILRITEGNVEFYFGLAAFALAVFGAVCSKKKSVVGFASAVIIFICTTSSMYVVLEKLPGSQYLWMLRFISIALCMILYSFLTWDTLKRGFVILCCVLLVADTVPSLTLIYSDDTGKSATERMKEQADNALITDAREVTTQRVAIMDESTLAATGQYLMTSFGEEKVQGTFGAGWQSAATAYNIVQLNEALSQGCYTYMFDRALELGNDTVLVKISQLKYKEDDITRVKEAADKVGYRLVKENAMYLLYHYDTYKTFGTITKYNGIGIGHSSSVMALNYPDIEEGESDNINDYSYEELMKYNLVYLAGFTYDNKDKAENLILKLSKAGVKVVINGDGIPADSRTQNQEFLGVTCNPIMFENGYPVLYTDKGETDCYLFAEEYSQWKSVYFNGLDNAMGHLYDNGVKVEFMGTVENNNIVFIGLNLTYHYALTHDINARELIDECFGNTLNDLPDRKIVPLEVEYKQDEIVINSEYNDVNTSLAYHDIFSCEEEVYAKNNLTYVNKGTTDIKMSYPYLFEGIIISVLGLILTTGFIFVTEKRRKKEGENVIEEV